MTQVDVKGTKLDVEDALCYLGDMLSSGGGCDSAISSRICVPGESLRNYCRTSRHLSLRVRSKVYTVSARLHGSERWGPNILDLKLLCRNYHAMIHWICGTKDCWNILSPTTPETWH